MILLFQLTDTVPVSLIDSQSIDDGNKNSRNSRNLYLPQNHVWCLSEFELWNDLSGFAVSVYLWYSAGLAYGETGKRDFIKDLGRSLAVLVKTERAEEPRCPWWVTASCVCYCCWAATRWLVSRNPFWFKVIWFVQNLNSIFLKQNILWGSNYIKDFLSVSSKSTSVTSNLKDGSVLFKCFSKPWQWASTHNTGALKMKMEFSHYSFLSFTPVLFNVKITSEKQALGWFQGHAILHTGSLSWFPVANKCNKAIINVISKLLCLFLLLCAKLWQSKKKNSVDAKQIKWVLSPKVCKITSMLLCSECCHLLLVI